MNTLESPAALQELVEALETVEVSAVVDTDHLSKAYSVVAR